MNIKIKSNSEEEAKEIQELFFKLGGNWIGAEEGGDQEIKYLRAEAFKFFSNTKEMSYWSNASIGNKFRDDDAEEFNLPTLRAYVDFHTKKDTGINAISDLQVGDVIQSTSNEEPHIKVEVIETLSNMVAIRDITCVVGIINLIDLKQLKKYNYKIIERANRQSK